MLAGLADKAVLKLGGSFLTDKSRPFHARTNDIMKLAKALKGFEGTIAVVHGGGSFGHSVALKYGISSRTTFSDADAIFETRKAMIELSGIISSSFDEADIKTYTIPAAGILRKDKKPRPDLSSILISMMDAKMVPITFGDVVPYHKGFTIVSGDYLSHIFCKAIRARRMVFLIDRPGIMGDDGKLLNIVTRKEISSMHLNNAGDATGGLAAKLEEALRIADSGVETAIMSGFDTDALISFLNGGKVQGTVVKS
jgi:isopentenyl phosphate kinase